MNLADITAVIPVRAGSRRLPKKNLAPFGGTTLLEHKIAQIKELLDPDQILVSSDSEEMLELAKGHGVQVHERSRIYADDVNEKSLGETIGHIAGFALTEQILWAQVTSPIVGPGTYKNAIHEYFRAMERGFDSLISVQRVNEYLRDAQGPLNYDIGDGHVPSQQLPEIWKVTYGVVLAPKASMTSWNYYYGNNPYLFEVDKLLAIDIDDRSDLLIAEMVAKFLDQNQ